MNDIPKQETSRTASIPRWELANAGSDAAGQFFNQGAIVVKAMTDWNMEYSRFVTHRMSRTAEAAAQVASCRSLPEALAVQARWLQAIFCDYVEETERLVAVNSKLIGNVLPQSS